MLDKIVKEKNPMGISVIKKVIDDLHKLEINKNFQLEKNVIFNVSDLINSEYSSDLDKFRVATSQINFIIKSINKNVEASYNYDYTKDIYNYDILIFTDNKSSNLDQVNLTDLLGLFDIDINEYQYLSRCTVHVNRLYLPEQISMVPCIWYRYTIDESKK